MQRFFGLGCWPDLHHWPGVHENVVNRNWDADKRRSDRKIVRGKRDRGDQKEGSQTRLYAGFLLLANAPTRVKPRHPPITLSPLPLNRLTSAPEYILSLPVCPEGGDICGERLAGKQCVLQFAPRSLQRQTRLRSLPQGHSEVMHFYTHWHIHHSSNAN